jgi:hypothetical protein
MLKLLALPVTVPLAAVRGAITGAAHVIGDALLPSSDGDGAAPARAPVAPAGTPGHRPWDRPDRGARDARPRPPAPVRRPSAPPPPIPVPAEPAPDTLEELAEDLGLAEGHVDEPEPELVESEGGATPGAELRIAEPWPGYRGQRAADIVARLARADDATKAVVRLYESTNRGRRSVLAATEG